MTAAVILTHNRPELLVDCVAAIGPQVDLVLVVDNASDPPVDHRALPASPEHPVLVVQVPDQPPNLARFWNMALDILLKWPGSGDPRNVAFLCDDTTVPDGWMTAVVAAMVETGAAAGCSNPSGHPHPPQVKHEPDSDLMGRMVGWAFVLDTTKGLRADESMHWWWFDTDLDWQARKAGGMVMIGGYAVPNHRYCEYTNTVPGLAERAGQDQQAFAAKWGRVPW